MPKSAREVDSGLQRKGFIKEENDHSFFTLHVNGKETIIYTKISHGERELHNSQLSVMARQLRINRSQLADLVDCRLTQPAYLKILQDGGHI